MTDKIEELADHLRGTCKGLDEACEQLFDHDSTALSVEECQELDGLVFCCDQCGWWCELNEESEAEPGLCEGCSPNEDE